MRRLHSIWLADDDIDDCEVFEDAITKLLPAAMLTIIPNGEELMQSLTADYPPDILFLDLNMPCKDGLDCLKEIRAQREFSRLPIIIFSSSIQPQHVDTSYRYGANLFYSKPSTFTELIAGLSDLLKMNWDDPYTVTSSHYVNNKYVAYKANADTV
jgi:DNA-binding NarL/FixJ family response regulator